ncbi:CMP-N-acetylneuraminate-beta-galactosamide-alpha-2,3-sialyltransferase 1-like [Salminus brasiliensis]|uniref:CMP-N-acetylneuraminate-beta-galactosamide- alpha-2,3-sialyltransferase 1-like n=1 Tax=Salminus brasiliensis TaxID=930266 RepID=UPI003B8365A1
MLWLKRRKVRALAALFFIVSFSTFLLSCTVHDPSFFFRSSLAIPAGPCACQHCITELEDDTWFSDKLNHSVQLLLTRTNAEVSDDTYKWWQWLQSESNPANLSVVLDRLFQVIPGEDCYMDAGPTRCRTCSVVGNSGNLRSSGYGHLIDAADFVIRINQAPTEGFEEDVGYKTTHHVMYPESAIDLNSNSTNLLLVPFKTLDLEWIISALTTGTVTYTYMPVMPRIKVNRNKVLVYSPAFLKYVHETWLDSHGRYPSTGFLSLVFALHICDEVNVFGFGADRLGSWHHYWEENSLGRAFRHTGVHDGDYEYNITQLLADKGKIRLFKGVSKPLMFQWDE